MYVDCWNRGELDRLSIRQDEFEFVEHVIAERKNSSTHLCSLNGHGHCALLLSI